MNPKKIKSQSLTILSSCLIYQVWQFLVIFMIYASLFMIYASLCVSKVFAQVPLEERFEERVQLVLEKMSVDEHVRKSSIRKSEKHKSAGLEKNSENLKTTENLKTSDHLNDCGFDLFESNQSRGQSKLLKFEDQRDQREVQINAKICGLDEDWFSVALEQGQIIELVIMNTSSARFQSIEVFGPRARKSMKLQKIKADFRFHVRKTGRYKFRIKLVSNLAENEMMVDHDYHFTIRIITHPIKS